ncbi:hypothetical protein [Polaromonas sp. CG9_12]|nr:hypothetical protein [Polaromonas sp. CG9_12]
MAGLACGLFHFLFLSVWDAQVSYENSLLLRVLGAIMESIPMQK